MRSIPTGPNGESCVEKVNHQKIKFSGPRTSTFYLLNPNQRQVEKIKVDGCAIVTGKSCDWMARIGGNSPEEIFIELKSAGRMQKAALQLEATIKTLSEDIKNLKKRCFVVFRSIHIPITALQKYGDQFKRKYNARIMTVRNCQEILL